MTPADAKTYAPVLERMVEILGDASGERVSFGEALTRAAAAAGVVVPPDMEWPLLSECFRIISAGRIPGLPDA